MAFAKMAIDADLATNGITVDLGEGEFVTVARAMNTNFQKEFRKTAKKYGNAWQSLGDDKQEQLAMEVYCRTVLLGWTGFEKEYSHATAVEVMLDPANVEFRELVEKLASTNETFRKEVIEEVVKN